jgi:hypothetical protein
MMPLFNSNGSSPIASISALAPLATIMFLSPLQRALLVMNPYKEFAM